MYIKRRKSKFKMASINNADFIYSKMAELKDIFPHIRKDYVLRMIKNKNVIFEKEVVIIFQQYKKSVKLGFITAPKQSYILHQIINISPGSGNAHIIMNKFLKRKNVFLTVRSNNTTAINFYIKNGFKNIGDIYWKNKQIKGFVMQSNRQKSIYNFIRRKQNEKKNRMA